MRWVDGRATDTVSIVPARTVKRVKRSSGTELGGPSGHEPAAGPIHRLPVDQQKTAVGSLLRLPDHIGLRDPRRTVPLMVDLVSRHPRLNLLNLEAAAAARALDATVWLSPDAAEGILPGVLDAERIPWSVQNRKS